MELCIDTSWPMDFRKIKFKLRNIQEILIHHTF